MKQNLYAGITIVVFMFLLAIATGITVHKNASNNARDNAMYILRENLVNCVRELQNPTIIKKDDYIEIPCHEDNRFISMRFYY